MLLLIMMSNNFIEIKGSVFKKFEKNNLFQVKHILWVMIIFITRLPVPMFANDFIYSGFYTLYWFEIWANVIGQLKQLKIFYHIILVFDFGILKLSSTQSLQHSKILSTTNSPYWPQMKKRPFHDFSDKKVWSPL